MPREKPNYGEMLQYLKEEYPELGLLPNKTQVAKSLKLSRGTVTQYVKDGKLTEVSGRIPIGSIARLLCA